MAQVELHCLVGTKEYKYIGRFLGFIKDDEFNAICQSKTAAGKIESKETKPLIDVCQRHADLTGHRLIMTVKKANDTTVIVRKLFISEKLSFISSVDPSNKKAVFVSESENNLVMREIE